MILKVTADSLTGLKKYYVTFFKLREVLQLCFFYVVCYFNKWFQGNEY